MSKNENQGIYEFKSKKEMVSYWKSQGIDVPLEILDPLNEFGWKQNLKEPEIEISDYSEYEENIILYDWLTFTSHSDTPEKIIEFMGLDGIEFTNIHGFYGYNHRYYYSGISIHFGGREEMGVCLEMSGEGCRVFETFGNGDWESLFKRLISSKDYNITRLDVAFDDHTGVLNITKLAKLTRKRHCVSKATEWEVVYSSKGISTYIIHRQ